VVKKFNPVWLFIACAAVAQGVVWVNLFSLIHSGILVYIGGIPAGLAIVGLIVYSSNLLPRVQSNRARRAGWIMLTLVMIAEPVVLGVVNWWFMPAAFRLTLGSYIVAGGASLIVSFVLVLGALVDRSLLPAEKPAPKPATATPQPPRKGGKKAKSLPQAARKPVTDDMLLAYLASNPGESQQQVAEHFGVSRQAIGQRVKKLYEVKQ
jgi:hypothetical protein